MEGGCGGDEGEEGDGEEEATHWSRGIAGATLRRVRKASLRLDAQGK